MRLGGTSQGERQEIRPCHLQQPHWAGKIQLSCWKQPGPMGSAVPSSTLAYFHLRIAKSIQQLYGITSARNRKTTGFERARGDVLHRRPYHVSGALREGQDQGERGSGYLLKDLRHGDSTRPCPRYEGVYFLRTVRDRVAVSSDCRRLKRRSEGEKLMKIPNIVPQVVELPQRLFGGKRQPIDGFRSSTTPTAQLYFVQRKLLLRLPQLVRVLHILRLLQHPIDYSSISSAVITEPTNLSTTAENAKKRIIYHICVYCCFAFMVVCR